MPGQIVDGGGFDVLRHIPTTPTVTVRVPKDSLTRYLNALLPYVNPAGSADPEMPNVDKRRVHISSRWLEGWDTDLRQQEWEEIQKDCPLDPNAPPGSSFSTQSWYKDRIIQFADFSNYRLLGKTPHLDPPDAVRPMNASGLLNYMIMDLPIYKDPTFGIPLYQIDTGWFEGMDTYYFTYGDDPDLSMTKPGFPLRYRLACLYTAILSDLVHVTNRFRYKQDPRKPTVPLLRYKGLVGFGGNGYTAFIEQGVLECFWDQYDLGFSIDLQTGAVTDLGDPADEKFEAAVELRWGNWFMPSNRDYRHRSDSNKTIFPGMRFTDLFTEHATRGVAEVILADRLDWDDSVSCDHDIPFGSVAGFKRLRRCSPEIYRAGYDGYESPTAPLLLGANTDIAQVVESLRDAHGIGSVVRQNGLALTTTAEAVKSEDHHLLEMVSKSASAPTRSRGRTPEHKRVYTVENAEAFKTYLVEGQKDNAERNSVIPGKTQWEFLMGLGSIIEGYNTWNKAALKEDQKLLRKYSRDNPGTSVSWEPFPPLFNVKVEVVA